MKIWTSWRRTAAVLVAGALVLTACGGEEEPEDTATEEESEDTTDDEETDDEEMDEEEDADGGMAVEIGTGVTEEPCPEDAPETVNADNGCIYLGVISDLSAGPFANAGPSITDAQIAFWTRVNEDGGIGGAYDVNITEHIRDNLYNPETHNQVYQEIKPNILALAQSLGSPTTQAIADDLEASNIVAAPAGWSSVQEFQSFILESGNNYCVETSNALDYYVQENGEIESVLAVHLPGDYGWDGAAGAKKWAEANGVEFNNVQITDSIDPAVSEIANTSPDVVILTVIPPFMTGIVGTAAQRGYEGFFIGNAPTWDAVLLEEAAGAVFESSYWQAGPWAPYDADTEAHEAMREQLNAMAGELESFSGPESANIFVTAGWAWSYPLLAALEGAYEAGALTRESLFEVAGSLESVDYENMLPPEAGNFAGTPKEQSFDQTVISAPDPDAPGGTAMVQDLFSGPTAQDFPFDQPCYVEEGFAG